MYWCEGLILFHTQGPFALHWPGNGDLDSIYVTVKIEGPNCNLDSFEASFAQPERCKGCLGVNEGQLLDYYQNLSLGPRSARSPALTIPTDIYQPSSAHHCFPLAVKCYRLLQSYSHFTPMQRGAGSGLKGMEHVQTWQDQAHLGGWILDSAERFSPH